MSEPSSNEIDRNKLADIRRAFESQITDSISGSKVIELPAEDFKPDLVLISFEGTNGELVAALLAEKGIDISTGSRCGGGGISILSELNIPYSQAMGTVEFTLSPDTNVSELIRAVSEAVSIARSFT